MVITLFVSSNILVLYGLYVIAHFCSFYYLLHVEENKLCGTNVKEMNTKMLHIITVHEQNIQLN